MTYSELFNYATVGTARQIELAGKEQILSMAQELIWRAYPWRWTLKYLPPFWLTGLESDYGSPLVVLPSDFQELHSAQLVRLSTPISVRTPLTPQKNIQLLSRVGIPEAICYVPETRSFRVYPRPPQNFGAGTVLIDGTYKKLPPSITPDNYMSTEIPSQDHQRQMWVLAITWAYYEITKDPKAELYYKRARQIIDETVRAEATSLGEPRVHPERGIIRGGSYRHTSFGNSYF